MAVCPDKPEGRRGDRSRLPAERLQIRQGYQIGDLDSSATEFLSLNGIHDPNALVQVCMDPVPDSSDPNFIHHNQALCKVPPQKLVRVYATGTAYLAFLPVIGIDKTTIMAEAISETASVDVVLVLDRSDSMTWGADVGDPMRDPSICNNSGTSADGYVGDCEPFDKVKRAAVSFVENRYFPYDSVSVVTFDKDARIVMPFSSNEGDIIAAIKNLRVFQGETSVADQTGQNAIYPNGNPSRWYDPGGVYYGLDCPQADPAIHATNPTLYPDYPSPAPCTTTNIGAGLQVAGAQFLNEPPQSLWVVILLTDGVANAGYSVEPSGKHDYYCPGPDYTNTWDNSDIPPKCNDGDKTTRHPNGLPTDPPPPDYDAEDYAYDSADYIAGQHALFFTIGLGQKVQQVSTVDQANDPGNPNLPGEGEMFLKYAAEIGEGIYTYAENGAALDAVFSKISANIATRLAH